MSKFATKKVTLINAKELVEELVIDDICQLDTFEKSLNGTTYSGEFITLLRFVEYLADGNSLPVTKFRHLQGSPEGIKECEFKSKHLRLYAIQLPSKKLIISGGFKNTQNDDISHFRRLTLAFLNSKTSKKS